MRRTRPQTRLSAACKPGRYIVTVPEGRCLITAVEPLALSVYTDGCRHLRLTIADLEGATFYTDGSPVVIVDVI